MNKKSIFRIIRFIIIFPIAIIWEIVGRFWEFWHFSISQRILEFMRFREKVIMSFIHWHWNKKQKDLDKTKNVDII